MYEPQYTPQYKVRFKGFIVHNSSFIIHRFFLAFLGFRNSGDHKS
jgi:hypothetical protein